MHVYSPSVTGNDAISEHESASYILSNYINMLYVQINMMTNEGIISDLKSLAREIQ